VYDKATKEDYMKRWKKHLDRMGEGSLQDIYRNI
jgi:hypothetical protein